MTEFVRLIPTIAHLVIRNYGMFVCSYIEGTDLSLSVSSQLSLADGRDTSDHLVRKKRDEKSNRKKTPNVLSNFFSTLPRRFSQSPNLSTPGDHPSPTPSDDQKKNGKKSKRRPPTLPAEWTNGDKVPVADTSKMDLETAPAVVRNAASGKDGSKASKSSMAVSVQLNRLLSNHAQSPNSGRPIHYLKHILAYSLHPASLRSLGNLLAYLLTNYSID